MYDIIYKKRNRYKINLRSPVFILPIENTFTGSHAPVWVIRPGDVQLKTAENVNEMVARAFGAQKTCVKDDFENFDVNLSAMSLAYFKSYELY